METLKIIDNSGMEYSIPVPGQIYGYLIALHSPPFTQDELYLANAHFEQIANDAKEINYPPDKA